MKTWFMTAVCVAFLSIGHAGDAELRERFFDELKLHGNETPVPTEKLWSLSDSLIKTIREKPDSEVDRMFADSISRMQGEEAFLRFLVISRQSRGGLSHQTKATALKSGYLTISNLMGATLISDSSQRIDSELAEVLIGAVEGPINILPNIVCAKLEVSTNFDEVSELKLTNDEQERVKQEIHAVYVTALARRALREVIAGVEHPAKTEQAILPSTIDKPSR